MKTKAAHRTQTHKSSRTQRWLSARTGLLVKEKEFTRLGDKLSQARRNLPWEAINKQYVFEGPKGKEGLSSMALGLQ